MRIVCISDTHDLHSFMEMYGPLPKGDILLHAGDVSNIGEQPDVTRFVNWFMNIKGFDSKIFIAGNHDFAFDKINKPHRKGDFDWFHNIMSEENLSQSDVTYLEDSFITIESPEFSRPIKFYGSPWQPEFHNWAFNLPRGGDEMFKKWNMIPEDTDVLITHGPAENVRDFVPNGQIVGCGMLRHRIETIRPALHVCGHIHNGYGSSLINDIMYVNASICTERYVPSNKPIVVDLKEVDGKILAYLVEDETN
jgi:hypothetical protein